MKVDLKVKKSSLIRRILISIGIAVSIILFEYFGLMQVVDNYIFDIVYMQDNPVDLPITIVAIDDKTINYYQSTPIHWPRSYYADLINTLFTDKSEPDVVAFDIVFSDKDKKGDQELADVAAKHRDSLVFGTTLTFDETIIDNDHGVKEIETAHIDEVTRLFPELEAVNPIKGYTNNHQVYDKYIRTFIPCFNNEEYQGDSFAYTVYLKYCEKNGIDPVDFRNGINTQYRFSYSGGPDTVETVSFVDVITGEIDPLAFKNRIVFVGAHANGLQDDFFVPSDHTSTMYGVEVHANITEAINDGAYQTDANQTTMGIIYGVIAAIVFFVMCFLPLQLDAIIAVFFVGANLLIGRILYDNGTVISQFSFFLAILFSFIGMVIHHYIKEGAQKRKLSKAFKMYVAPQIVEEVAEQGDFELNLGGRNKDIAVLFIDIRGFTTMSENLSPEEVVNILNEYFAVVTDAVFKNKGTIDKFIGDACMAVFNSPFDLDDYVYRGVHTGWDILQSGQKLQNTLMEKYGRTINFGIGVNCGEAVIGNIGCEFRMDYTAIGDTVNTSSRLESNAKAGQLLISEEVLRRLEGRIEVEEIGAIPLKGKSKSIMVYNVIGIKEAEE